MTTLESRAIVPTPGTESGSECVFLEATGTGHSPEMPVRGSEGSARETPEAKNSEPDFRPTARITVDLKASAEY